MRTAEDSVMEQGAASSAQRLIITEMVLENFKSYAGVQHVGPFHKCFSSVIGPNGSGKSNVIDAMLFVFGKRAKQLRLNKVSELIHNSTYHQNLEFARVSVHFSDIIDTEDDGFELVPNSSFVITRIAYRNNSSKYFVDDKLSNFTEVTTLLKRKKIDLDNNRFLILQGEVEQIAMMKPKAQTQHDEGLLEYLEDIIGTNRYIEKIEEGSKLLEELNEKRQGMVHRVQAVESELNDLQNSKIEAELYFSKEWKKSKWTEKYYELYCKEEEELNQQLNLKREEMQENLKIQRDAVEKYSSQAKEKETKFNSLQEKYDLLFRESEACVSKFKEFERKDIKFREDSKQSKAKIKKIEEKIQKDLNKLEEMEIESKNAESTIPNLTNVINELNEKQKIEEKSLDEFIKSTKDEVEKYRQELSDARSKLDPWDKQINDHRGKSDVARSECSILTEKHETAKRKFEEAKNNFNSLRENVAVKEKQLNHKISSIGELKSRFSNVEKEETECISEERNIEKKFLQNQSKVAELSKALSDERSQSEMLSALMELRRSGRIPGIHGRLGDLGAIDKKYDVAISTACSALDYIVVDTAETAQSCVNFLRERKLGIATFLILEKQQGLIREMNEKVVTPENAPRLFDLIRLKNENLKPAFFFALRHTLVAKDIEQGARISYSSERRFRRVVTLEGALFESSGTMSGGGGTPKGGKMGGTLKDFSVSKTDLEEAEKEMNDWKERLESIRMKRSALTQEKNILTAALSFLEVEIPKLTMEVEEMKSQLAEITNAIEEMKVDSSPPQEELEKIDQLKAYIESEDKEIEMMIQKSKNLREKVDALQKQVQSVGSEDIQKFKLNLNDIQNKIDSNSSEINRLKVLLQNHGRHQEKIKRMIEENKNGMEKEKKRLEEMKEEHKLMENEAFVVHDSHENSKKKLESTKIELDEVKKDYTEFLNEIKKLKSSEVDIQFKYDDLIKDIRICESKINDLQKKLTEAQNNTQNLYETLDNEGLISEELRSSMTIPSSQMKINKERAQSNAKILEEELKKLNPNMSAISDYRNKFNECEERKKELDTVSKERDVIKQQNDDLKKKRLDEFMDGFNSITTRLKEMYQMITLGGDAELELVDSLDPFSEGIIFSVRPPKKSWKNISNLSGGEKTLSSLALVFALHHYKPTPLYVMDEIDAALDFKNVSIVAHYIKERTRNAQFIIISLRNNMFELANRLVGIFKTENCTKSLTIDPSSFSMAR